MDWAVPFEECEKKLLRLPTILTLQLDCYHYYAPGLQALGLKELWQQFGTGEKRRMLPLHQAVAKLGYPLVKVVIKLHIDWR